jgi:hypothetical protein
MLVFLTNSLSGDSRTIGTALLLRSVCPCRCRRPSGQVRFGLVALTGMYRGGSTVSCRWSTAITCSVVDFDRILGTSVITGTPRCARASRALLTKLEGASGVGYCFPRRHSGTPRTTQTRFIKEASLLATRRCIRRALARIQIVLELCQGIWCDRRPPVLTSCICRRLGKDVRMGPIGVIVLVGDRRLISQPRRPRSKAGPSGTVAKGGLSLLLLGGSLVWCIRIGGFRISSRRGWGAPRCRGRVRPPLGVGTHALPGFIIPLRRLRVILRVLAGAWRRLRKTRISMSTRRRAGLRRCTRSRGTLWRARKCVSCFRPWIALYSRCSTSLLTNVVILCLESLVVENLVCGLYELELRFYFVPLSWIAIRMPFQNYKKDELVVTSL